MDRQITFTLNGVKRTATVPASQFLLETLRGMGCKSVKRGCETSGCGLCTVWLDGTPVLSCTVLAVRAEGHAVTTLEGFRMRPGRSAATSPTKGANSAATAPRG